MTRDELIVSMHEVMDAVSGLPSEDIANVEGLIRVGELLVGFETLCTQLYEWEIPLRREHVDELIRVGQQLGAAPRYTDSISELPAPGTL